MRWGTPLAVLVALAVVLAIRAGAAGAAGRFLARAWHALVPGLKETLLIAGVVLGVTLIFWLATKLLGSLMRPVPTVPGGRPDLASGRPARKSRDPAAGGVAGCPRWRD